MLVSVKYRTLAFYYLFFPAFGVLVADKYIVTMYMRKHKIDHPVPTANTGDPVFFFSRPYDES